MPGYDESTYGERIAETYDMRPEIPTDTDDTVAFLAEVAGKGPVLELGIGTGRIALPLASRALQVSGIDASPAMVAKLREKPGGSRLPVTLGNFADVAVEGRFTLVYVVFNTFFGLLSQDDQVRCFANVAARLQSLPVQVRPGGPPRPGLEGRFGGHPFARSMGWLAQRTLPPQPPKPRL